MPPCLEGKKNIRRFVLKNNHLSYINTYVHIANKKLVSLYDISTKHMIKTYTKQSFSEKRYTKKKNQNKQRRRTASLCIETQSIKLVINAF